jgi:uncharacterized membrane protein YjgN (DUF898 family)
MKFSHGLSKLTLTSRISAAHELQATEPDNAPMYVYVRTDMVVVVVTLMVAVVVVAVVVVVVVVRVVEGTGTQKEEADVRFIMVAVIMVTGMATAITGTGMEVVYGLVSTVSTDVQDGSRERSRDRIRIEWGQDPPGAKH